ncbi:hypothetical protein [Flavobacterium terrae]|uniref:Uncharacterized protein n=1 Tax=Flavobacterium terrae TaxID=415425 RepID=A0A1M6DCS7_9FLAO|nr:hypothetical protein [Flavobacterium terrae]SHI70955.1 hypothetical protein SAMN05444363_1367 [Flavobacterium terrae]
MKKIIVYILPLFSLFWNCKEEQKPKVKYDKPLNKVEVKKDTSKLMVADLPIQFANSNVLIYTIGALQVSNFQKSSYTEKIEAGSTYNVSNVLEDELTGYLQNIKFQEIGSDSLHVLTDKLLMIERVTFLKSKKVLVYVLADADTNQDSKVDSDDIKSLYISTDMGKNFTKVSPELQELIDWNYVEAANKIFFRTIDDRNKNGAFDKNDDLHYFTVNINKDWKAEEFKVVK